MKYSIPLGALSLALMFLSWQGFAGQQVQEPTKLTTAAHQALNEQVFNPLAQREQMRFAFSRKAVFHNTPVVETLATMPVTDEEGRGFLSLEFSVESLGTALTKGCFYPEENMVYLLETTSKTYTPAKVHPLVTGEVLPKGLQLDKGRCTQALSQSSAPPNAFSPSVPINIEKV